MTHRISLKSAAAFLLEVRFVHLHLVLAYLDVRASCSCAHPDHMYVFVGGADGWGVSGRNVALRDRKWPNPFIRLPNASSHTPPLILFQTSA